MCTRPLEYSVSDSLQANSMQIPILIEPVATGLYRAKAGEPFALSAEGVTPSEATERLETVVRERLKAGSYLGVINLDNGSSPTSPAPLRLEPLPDDDWFFQTMREAIAENRQRENE